MPTGSTDYAAESDYGSDFGEDGDAQLQELLDALEACSSTDLPDVQHGRRLRVAQASQLPGLPHYRAASSNESIEDSYLAQAAVINASAASDPLSNNQSPGHIRWEIEDSDFEIEDGRSPLERFRMAPKKPFSVTDFVSPAWCELQYLYYLVKFGKKKQTSAMKRGSEVHKVLEDQVHLTVPVDVQTREDYWGLKIWNVIQGLRTLRATKMTRELELWGIIDGQVINGIIDELSFTCPDIDLEHSVEKLEFSGQNENCIPPNQTDITQYFAASHETTLDNQTSSTAKAPKLRDKIYLTDVKTRRSNTLPDKIAMRPTEIQLMLYRRLLVDMASNNVNQDTIFSRYSLKPSENFSDALIAQLSSIDFNFHTLATNDSRAPVESEADAVTELLEHNSLTKLWSLMMDEFQKTLPHGGASIGKVLSAEFRRSTDGSVIGAKTFPYKDQTLLAYVADEMQWWKGERQARGVELEEAFKCRTCPFAEECTWRLAKVEDAVSAARKRHSTENTMAK